ncbi:MAG: metalloregulator ArsR/SmtB family transcription factor [Anaerolineae bacterium]
MVAGVCAVNGHEQLAVIMKAMAHPVRLQILQILSGGEACVCHMEAMLGQRQAYISQQLMKLREAGLVIDRREGMNVFYSLASESIRVLLRTARSTAESLTGPQGGPLEFALPAPPGDARCSCPVCQGSTPLTSPVIRIRTVEDQR